MSIYDRVCNAVHEVLLNTFHARIFDGIYNIKTGRSARCWWDGMRLQVNIMLGTYVVYTCMLVVTVYIPYLY